MNFVEQEKEANKSAQAIARSATLARRRSKVQMGITTLKLPQWISDSMEALIMEGVILNRSEFMRNAILDKLLLTLDYYKTNIILLRNNTCEKCEYKKGAKEIIAK